VRALLALLLLAGCARDSRPALEVRAGGMIGRPVAELVAWLGQPGTIERGEAGGGETALAWRYDWSGSGAGLAVGMELARNYVCKIVFTSRSGKVTGYRLDGAPCGWAGLPGPLPQQKLP